MRVDALVIIKNGQGTATQPVVAEFKEHTKPGSFMKSMSGSFEVEPFSDFAKRLYALFSSGKSVVLMFAFRDGEQCAEALVKRMQPANGYVEYLISGGLQPCKLLVGND